jgi:galactokinase
MDLRTEFIQKFGREPEIVARAPGRVNLLGEHVDYNDGPVLPVALDKAVSIAAAPSEDDVVNLYALDLGEQGAFRLSALEDKISLDGSPLPNWAHYPAGIAWAILDAGFEVRGLQAVYTSDIPIGAGLSSSAAVEVGFAVLWQSLGGWSLERMKLAQLCQRAENIYVGVECGLMDQFASACGVEGHVLYFDTQNLDWEALPLLPGKAIIVADSGVRRDLTSSAYNERRASCDQAVELLRNYLPNIRSLRDVSPTEMAALGYYLPPIVKRRAEHVVREIARVQSAVSALKRADDNALGALMFSGHASLRDLYEVSTPELDALVDIARELPGCVGARLTGAGFGGCTVNLVEQTMTGEFTAGLQGIYLEQTGRETAVYLCQASDGAQTEKF